MPYPNCRDEPQILHKSSLTRREFLGASVAAGALTTVTSPAAGFASMAPTPQVGGNTLESFVVQWKKASPELPWLSELTVRAFDEGLQLKTETLAGSSSEFPNGLKAIASKTAKTSAKIQVRLGGGYGFLFSDQMLEQHPYLWVREMGIYISRLGTWEETEKLRAEAADLIRRSLERPYQSCAEKYYEWTGHVEQGVECKAFNEPGSGLDDKVWDFVKEKEGWPAMARSVEHVNKMPEVDAAYFTDRFPDLQYSNMYLGWPHHGDKFVLWNSGKVGVSSQSVGGDPKKPWLPRAPGYTIQFGIGSRPRFRKYGDESVRQHLKNGFDLIVATEWSDAGMKVEQTNFAYPLESEQIRTGIEPMLNWTQMRIANEKPDAQDSFLGIEFTKEDFIGPGPAASIQDVKWRTGGFYLGEQLLAATDVSLAFEEVRTTGSFKRFRARIQLAPSAIRTFNFANFYRAGSPDQLSAIWKLGYETALKKTTQFWDRLQKQGASIIVPDQLLNNLFRTFLPRVAISAALDPDGLVVLHTGPVGYSYSWHHCTAFGVANYLSRRGHFELAKLYLEPFFRWQGVPMLETQRRKGMPQQIRSWKGFFGAPPEQSPILWLMFHGMIQWACARYFQLSGDRAWLDSKLPALLKSMDWVKNARAITKTPKSDDIKPLNFGWLPPEQVDDGTFGSAIYTDAHVWQGMKSLSQVLESVSHPRAAEFRAETEDYRTCLQDSMRRTTAESPIVRLNDDTWMLYMPLLLERKRGEAEGTIWFSAVDSTAQTLLETQLFPSGSVENSWLLNYFEDSHSPLVPSLPDAAPNAFHAGEYLHRDLVEGFLYTFYSQSTMTMARQTLTMYEMRSPGRHRIFELPPSSAGLWNVNFTEMLCRTVGNELWLMQATPRRWLNDGERIEVKEVQTEFGPVSLSVYSRLKSDSIEARITTPNRRAPKSIRIRFRVPDGRKMQSVTVNGNPWRDFDPDGEWVIIPGSSRKGEIIVHY